MKKTLFILFASIVAACSSQPQKGTGETIWSLNSTFSRLGNKYAIADTNGVPVTDYLYDALEGLSNGNILATANGKQFILSKDGKRAADIEFDHFDYCFNGCAIIDNGGLYGLLATTGKLLLPAEYNSIKFITPELAAATKGGCTVIVNNLGYVLEQTTLPPDSIAHNLSKYEELLRKKQISDESYWNNLLDRYEALCNCCIEAKIVAKSSGRSHRQNSVILQEIVKEAMAIGAMLDESSGQMTPPQLERFNTINDKYFNYEE